MVLSRRFKFLTLCLLGGAAVGCMNVPGIVPDGRRHSNIVDYSLFRRPGNAVADLKDDPVHQLAKDLTVIEDDIRRDGSITVKRPDVWGDAGMMSHLQEFEEQMRTRTVSFKESIQGFRSEADSGKVSFDLSVDEVISPLPSTGTSDDKSSSAAPASQGSGASAAKTEEAELFKAIKQVQSFTEKDKLSLEPTELARQEAVYIDVCQALRRRHLGDDQSRLPGYGLYKVRIPISVLPGRETSKGYSAIATLRARLNADAAHLKHTFPRMVAADLVNHFVPYVKAAWNSESTREAMSASDMLAGTSELPAMAFAGSPSSKQPQTQTLDHGGQEESDNPLVEQKDITAKAFAESPATVIGTLTNVTTIKTQKVITLHVKQELKRRFSLDTPKDEEVRDGLRRLFAEVHLILEQNDAYNQFGAWVHQYGRDLFLGKYDVIKAERIRFLNETPFLASLEMGQREAAWFLLLQSGQFNQSLKRLLVRLAEEGKVPNIDESLMEDETVQFYNLKNGFGERSAYLWNTLIQQEFPLYVFAVDPQTEEQVSADALARNRELQIALAYSIAKQPLNARARIAMSRELSLDETVIGLNRTVVSFAHGNDTFGWYFRPRLQTPPTEQNNIAAFARTVWSTGPTEHYDLKNRELEPGIRECEVLIVMPNFIRSVAFDVTTNWECMAKPGVTKRSYEEMLAQGRKIHELKTCMPNLTTAGCYRPGDVERLISRIDQLDAMLGMQTHVVNLPYDAEQSGKSLFGPDRSSLRPSIQDFYGLTFLKGDSPTAVKARFFLRGGNFHPTETHAIVGGGLSDGTKVHLLSRELLWVEVDGLKSELSDLKKGFEIRIGTPSGISNPLFVTNAESVSAAPPSGFSFVGNVSMQGTILKNCCAKPSIVVPRDTPLRMAYSPGNPFTSDVERSLVLEITGVTKSGKPIVFGDTAKKALTIDTNAKLSYVPTASVWEVSDVIHFWTSISNELIKDIPRHGDEDFVIQVAAYVGHEKTEVTKTLNTIQVTFTVCDCPANTECK